MSEAEPKTARTVAARVLERVLGDGAFAAAALDAELGRTPLAARERSLATEIVYGALRTRGALQARLADAAPRGLPGDSFVVAHLLSAAYQVLALDRVPAHAAVDAAVGAVRAKRGAKVAGFVNAVLRRISATRGSFDRAIAVLESAPPWLRTQMERAVGAEETRALLGSMQFGERRSTVRLVAGKNVPEWLEHAEAGRVAPHARRVARGGDLRRREGFVEGTFVIQEEGAQAAALALGARSGERILDACAGRGQKTSLLAEQVSPGGVIWAVDRHPAKLEALAAEFRRLGLPPPRTASVDWTVGVADVPDDFDRVLVDAPCSGTGTLVRRPEILLRLEEGDVENLALSSEQILRRAASRAKPGGRVVFAVCSVLERECEGVVEAVRDVLEPVAFDAPELPASLGLSRVSHYRLFPTRHGTDGFFLASFRRPGAAGPTR